MIKTIKTAGNWWSAACVISMFKAEFVLYESDHNFFQPRNTHNIPIKFYILIYLSNELSPEKIGIGHVKRFPHLCY